MKKITFNQAAPAFYSVLSILFSLITGAVILVSIGKNPLSYFGQLFVQGMFSPLGLVESIIKMAPLLIIAAGLLACFSAGLLNIGVEGQFLIGAVLAGWSAPALAIMLPYPVYLISVAAIGAAGGMFWVLLPAVLKARYDMNEIITTLMMNWVAINLVTWLVKGPINDLSTVPAQTALIPMQYRLSMIPFTSVHIGLVVGIVALFIMHYVIRRTTLGYEFRVLLWNKSAAYHAGMNVARITIWSLVISGGFAGLAGVSDVLAIKGLFQGDWNPAYGMTVIPLVFLARFNGWAVVPLAFFFSFLSVGGEFVARDQGVPIFFVHILEGLTLLFFAASEYLEKRRTPK